MARNWTEAQRAAIYTNDADLLIAAAAGSGKTAVLVERVIQKITDKAKPVDIDRLLVVTFTNAAAAEMRQRIAEELIRRLDEEPQNERLRRQLSLLSASSITTIHGFCHSLLRTHFDAAGLDPNFKIADTTENELLRLSSLEEVIEEMYEDPRYAEAFLQLTQSYMQIKNPEPFYQLVNRIYDFVMSLPQPEKWLREAAERFLVQDDAAFSKSDYVIRLLQIAKELIASILQKYDRMLSLLEADDGQEAFYAHLLEEKKQLTAFLAAEGYEDFYALLQGFAFATIPRSPKEALPMYREQVKNLRDSIKKKEWKRLQEEIFPIGAKEQRELFNKLHPVASALSELVSRLMERFDKKKNEKNILNFNDLEHGCLRLLTDSSGKPTALAEAVRERFDEILIDDYQDTSALQEAIFQAVRKEKALFQVGDIKQSIYRFRNTNPLLFQQKKEQYVLTAGAPQQKIILSQNFRSRPAVLEGINYIFSRIMSKEAGEITYDEEEMLYPGAGYPDMERPLSAQIELCLADLQEMADEDESLEATEAEAILAARKIEELIQGGYQVLAGGVVRPVTYRDICILMRSTKSHANCFAKILMAHGIPCYSESGGSFLESEEIDVMLSLLKIIDNPHQDIPLLAVLRSQMYAFSAEELAEIRLAEKKGDFFTALTKRAEKQDDLSKRLQDFLEALQLFRRKSRQKSIAELIWYLYMQTGFYEAQATLPGGTLRRLNLRLLYVRAVTFENTGLRGLYSFVRFIDEFSSVGGDYDAARTIGEEQNVVRIMSIHKSKGLEFPVVMVSGLGHKFNLRDLQEKVLIHSELGYGPQYVDTDLSLIYETVARSAIKHVLKQESLSEEERILYVALTRAREKLILLSAVKNLSTRLKNCAVIPAGGNIPASFVLEGNSYLDWLFMALISHPDAAALRDLLDIEMPESREAKGQFSVEIMDVFTPDVAEKEEEPEKAQEESEDLGSLLSLMECAYPYQKEAMQPAKITVTELKRKYNNEEPDTVYLYPRPTFLQKNSKQLTAAEVGTAMHTVLEHIDYENAGTQEAVALQIETMVQSGVLQPNEATAVSAEKIAVFMQSKIGKRLLQAEKVCREVSFGFYVPAQEIFGTNGKVMLQGMIDCVLFEEGGVSVLDYKTDRIYNEEETVKKYKIQLEAYGRAAETIYKKPLRHRYLYLFDTGRVLEI